MENLLGKNARSLNPRRKIIYSGGIYHLIQRAPGRELVFVKNEDYLYFLRILKEYSKKYKLDIFSFAFLPNHLHLLLRINSDNLSSAMQSLFTKYAVYFNNVYQRKGHVFYGNYRAFLCSDEKYLIAASIYIHLNPFKANLVGNPPDYRWSSLGVFLDSKIKSFVKNRYILELIDKDIERASTTYKEMINDSAKMDFEVYAGSHNVLRRSLIKIFSHIKSFSLGKDNRRGVVFWTEEALDNEIRKLRKKRRLRSKDDIAARNYLIQQLKANGFSMGEIASKLGVRRQALYHCLSSS